MSFTECIYANRQMDQNKKLAPKSDDDHMKLRVRELAEAQGYSIRKLSTTTSLAYTTVFRYWHDYISRPDPEVLKKLAQILAVDDWRTLISDEE